VKRRAFLTSKLQAAKIVFMPLLIKHAESTRDIETARALLREYAGYLNQSLGEEHICLDEYERELASLPGAYATPRGTILLAYVDDNPAGCIALKPLKPSRAVELGEAACEMKRLWVREDFRGQTVGLALAKELIEHARTQGYTAMYLDTVPAAMRSANRIYQALGFQPVERYNTNPILGLNPAVTVEFFRLAL
jgi:putative acetyltransferase